MLIDNTLILSDKQTVTSTGPSSQVIDQQAAGSAHTHAGFMVRVDEDFAGSTSVKISLQTADVSTFASVKEVFSATFAVADLKAGNAVIKAVLPAGLLRYIRGYYTVTGTGTAGKLSLFVTDTVDM